MAKIRCGICNKSFKTAHALSQHKESKHGPVQIPPKTEKKSSSKKYLIGLIILVIIFTVYMALPKSPQNLVEHIKGNPNASIEMVEFSDFQCSACGRAYLEVKKFMETHGDKVKLVYKHFPLSFHPNAQKAAEAAECAGKHGKFWEMHDKLFESQHDLGVGALKQYAVDIGLDPDEFNTCLDSGSAAPIVSENMNEGSWRGVSGTPTFFINGQKYLEALTFPRLVQITEV